MTHVTDRNGLRPGDQDQLNDEPVVVEDPFEHPAEQRLTATLGAGAVVALVAFVLWRLKVRRRPPSNTERLAEAAKSLGDASLSYSGRAAKRARRNAGPAARRAKKQALPVAERAGELAREGLQRGAEGAGDLATKAAGAGAVALAAGKAVGAGTASTAQKVGSGVAEMPDAVADAAHGVHKFWRKWTLRILMLLAAAIGYTAGAAAGRERYEQIVGAAQAVAQRPEVQSAQSKVMSNVIPDHGNPTV